MIIDFRVRLPLKEQFPDADPSDLSFVPHYMSHYLELYQAGLKIQVGAEELLASMEENGIDISRQKSNGLDEIPLDEIDVAVSMTGFPAAQYLPADFRGRVLDWDVDDPIGRPLATFRRVRDEIEDRVKDLLEEIRKARFSSKT